jgi:hypothetical protein
MHSLIMEFCTASCQWIMWHTDMHVALHIPPPPPLQVTFHDTSRHRARVPTLTDFYGFVAAAMGPRGVAYISRAAGGKGEASAQPSMLVRAAAAADMMFVGHCFICWTAAAHCQFHDCMGLHTNGFALGAACGAASSVPGTACSTSPQQPHVLSISFRSR